MEPQIDQKWKIANMEKPNMEPFFISNQTSIRSKVEETEDYHKMVKDCN